MSLLEVHAASLPTEIRRAPGRPLQQRPVVISSMRDDEISGKDAAVPSMKELPPPAEDLPGGVSVRLSSEAGGDNSTLPGPAHDDNDCYLPL